MSRTSKFYIGGLATIAVICLGAAVALLFPSPPLIVVMLMVWAVLACMLIIDFVGRV